MTVQFRQTGDAVDYTPGADVMFGEVVVQGELVGVAKHDIPAGKLGALAVTGVFNFPKAAGSSIPAGAKVYWNATAKVATVDAASGANKEIGKTILAAADTDTTVRVRLSQ